MKYIVIGTPVCGYCTQAKNLLERKELDYEYRCLTEVSPKEQDRLQDIAGQAFRTVPQIFTVEGETWGYVGGYTELNSTLNG
ncbi:MAG: glutaredoxin [Euryarchaeota archaeon]|nr:glutaredoxin [Euryarchaeota archaeon]|tara:strand:- start:27804 stop:28049 length:246 start_codon:yes stop_codon:yes gene_type:complete